MSGRTPTPSQFVPVIGFKARAKDYGDHRLDELGLAFGGSV
jgi:hypothetical protein